MLFSADPKGAHPSMDQWVNYRDVIPGCDSYGPNANPDFPCTNRSMFEALNNQLDWLYDEMDLLLPSLYGMGEYNPRLALIPTRSLRL